MTQLTQKKHFAPNLCEFGVACLEELEVNQCIALDIPILNSQSQHAKTLSAVLIYTKNV